MESSISDSFQPSLYFGIHYFLYLGVFSNQSIVNDDQLNLSSDNFRSCCSENSTSSNYLNDNPLIAKSSSFVFFNFVILGQSFDFHKNKVIYGDYHDDDDKESHLVQNAPILKTNLSFKYSHALTLSLENKLSFEF